MKYQLFINSAVTITKVSYLEARGGANDRVVKVVVLSFTLREPFEYGRDMFY